MASRHTARTPIRALASTGSGFEFLPPLRMHRDSHPASKSSAPGLLLLRVFGIVPSPPSSSGTGLMISMLQLVVEVLADGGQHDLHLAAGRLPTPGAKLDGARARLVALAADAQVAGGPVLVTGKCATMPALPSAHAGARPSWRAAIMVSTPSPT